MRRLVMRYLRLSLAITTLFVASSVLAQTTANLTGTVTLSGNPLPGVTVTISGPAMEGTRTAVSDENGNYNFGDVPKGSYRVKFEMGSMQTQTKAVVIARGQTARCDAEMTLSDRKKKTSAF